MKIVFPQVSSDSVGRTRTLTERIKELTPSTDDLIDAGFLLLLGLVAFLGFWHAFDTPQFLLVAAIGLSLGIVTAHLASVLRWHWMLVLLLVVVEFFLLGATVAVRESTIVGFIPTPDAFSGLGQLATSGWKEFLTTLPPVSGDGPFLALPYLMGLVAGAVGFWLARRSKRPSAALVVPVGLAVAVILLGTLQPAQVIVQGLALAIGGFVWLAVRTRRKRRLVGTGRSHRASLLTGVALVAAAGALGAATGGWLPGAEAPRVVLRTYVQPPVETKDLASPLVGFRKYSSKSMQQAWSTQLFRVEGAPAGALLRIAVLDDYTSHTWSASGGSTSSSGFQRVGARIPYAGIGEAMKLTLTFGPGYANASELGGWLPSLGENTDVAFSGANQKTHRGTFRYNLDTSQGLLSNGDRFHDGDVVSVDTIPFAQGLDPKAEPGGASGLDTSEYSFLATVGQRWSEGAATPGERVAAIATHLRAGYWSDGTRTGERQYVPGHSVARLASFASGQLLVGSDEQYAAIFALLCNQSGFPARVVFGAQVPAGGVVQGRDVRAWVELETADGWRTVPPDAFTPNREKNPPRVPQTVSKEQYATNVPPPNPGRLPLSSLGLSDSEMVGGNAGGGWWAVVLKWLLVVLQVAGLPVGLVGGALGGIVAAKAVRRHRRRKKGGLSSRVSGAWADVLDQCRDMGLLIPGGATRLEQSRVIGVPAVEDFAVRANTATFGLDDPTEGDVDELWSQAGLLRSSLLRSLTRWRRLGARFNLRSLLPERLAVVPLPKLPAVDLQGPAWLMRLTRGRRPAMASEDGQL